MGQHLPSDDSPHTNDDTLDDCGAHASDDASSSPVSSAINTGSSICLLDLGIVHDDPDMNSFATHAVHMETPSEESAAYVILDPNDLAVLSVVDAPDIPGGLDSDPDAFNDLGFIDQDHILRHVSASPFFDSVSPVFHGTKHHQSRSRRRSFKKSRGQKGVRKSGPARDHKRKGARTRHRVNLIVSQVQDLPATTPDDHLDQLHALDYCLQATKQTRTEFYKDLHDRDAASQSMVDRAHMDGGAQTNTTPDKSLLHHYQLFDSSANVPALRVADNTPHYPIGLGYLKIPTRTTDGFTLVVCFHTPTLAATLISPDRIGRNNGCRGYSTLSVFDPTDEQQCELRLHHCRTISQDLLFPLTSIRGLLFTDKLVCPTDHEHTSLKTPIKLTICPNPDQHLSEVSTDSVPSSASIPDPGPSSVPAADPATSCHCCSTQTDTFLPQDPIATAPSVCSCSSTSVPLAPLAPVPVALPPSLDSPSNEPLYIHLLNRAQLRVLWHHRLAHLHFRRLPIVAKQSIGIPELPTASPEIDRCPICDSAKLAKHNRSKAESRRATMCNQGISIDMGFIVQRSKNVSRFERLQGLNGETCYCLVTDHHSGTLYGATFSSKAPPIRYLNNWLAQHGCGSDVPDKYVRMDLGGELGRSPEIRQLFETAGYMLEPTAADSSHQNGPGERPHRTIKDALRSILDGAALPAKFWPYAFHHYIRLYNVVPHGDHSESPFTLCTGRAPDLRYLRTFGCRVTALPARTHRPSSLEHDACTGIFLGYTNTFKNIFYYDATTNHVKEAQHVAFDEGFVGTPDAECPPNVRLLRAYGQENDDAAQAVFDELDLRRDQFTLDVSESPYLLIEDVHMPFLPGDDHPLGMSFHRCDRFRRAYVSQAHRAAEKFRLRQFRSRFIGSYIVAIDDTPVFSLDDVHSTLDNLASLETPPSSVKVSLAPERQESRSASSRPAPHLNLHALQRITALNTVPGEGLDTEAYLSALDAKADSYLPSLVHDAVDRVHSDPANPAGPFADASLDSDTSSLALSYLIPLDGDPPPLLARLENSHMNSEERALKSFTRKRLQGLSNWSDWDAAFDSQLDGHHDSSTLNHPVDRPTSTADNPVHILRITWSNMVKDSGKRKARACIDGSKRAAPGLRDLTSTYASCIETPCMRLFFALAAMESFLVSFADTVNAFQQSPPPSIPCYLEIDDAYASWYLKRFGKTLDRRKQVIPVERALQGHPEASRLWERMIVGILVDQLGFISTTHERNLYRGKIDGKTVLVCRQVDDFAVASSEQSTAQKLIALINEQVTTEDQGIGSIRPSGVHCKYNGLDVHQTRDYIKLNCETYIGRLLQTHGWELPDSNTSDRHDTVPMTSETGSRLVGLLDGPPEGTVEHAQLCSEVGYSYRQVLGELTYAYVLCRPDIGYAVTLLSRFSTAPHKEHYHALRQICKYLRKTADWGIIYWRPKPQLTLPDVQLDLVELDPSLGTFPASPLHRLVGFVDAAHATDIRTRRSVTGYTFSLAGGTIAYKSKLQPVLATSSTEAEFLAAVHAAKTAKYLRAVLHDFGYLQIEPTLLHIDNLAAVHMINDNRPTPRARHIDIQFFAIQEWRAKGEILVSHLAGILNPSDQNTKPLGSQLHGRHARRAMGHYGPGT